MPDLLTADLHETVRRVLDVSLTEDALPDAVIDLTVFARAARLDVLRADPNAETYEEVGADAEKRAAVLDAVALFAAARIAPALPSITSETLGDYKYSRGAWDGSKRASELRGLANAALATYLETDGLTPVPVLFTTAPGYRGR